LAALGAARAASGIPHWIVVDEAHYFFREGAPHCRHLDVRTGNYLFVTYRPSQLASSVHATLPAHLVNPTAIDDERYFMTGVLQQRLPADAAARDALADIGPGTVGLLLGGPGAATWCVFQPGQRICPHTRHVRKYVDTAFSSDRAFYFHYAGNAQPSVAHSISEFAAAVAAVPVASLAHHLEGGDFSRWAADVIGDAVLAACFRKLENVVRDGGRPSRAELLAQIRARYHLGAIATDFTASTTDTAPTPGSP
jgi:hypothetical protein